MRKIKKIILVCIALTASNIYCQSDKSLSKITPENVIDFELPVFDEKDGYLSWNLFSSSAQFVSSTQINSQNLIIKVFDGSDKNILEATIESPSAKVNPKENIIKGDDEITINGTNYTLSGIGWIWLGKNKEIQILSNARLSFDEADSQTVISGDKLTMQKIGDENVFTFTNNVFASSQSVEISSDILKAFNKSSSDKSKENNNNKDKQNLEKVVAIGNVKIVNAKQKDKLSTCNKAVFYPKQNKIELFEKSTLVDQKSASSLTADKIVGFKDFEVLLATGNCKTIISSFENNSSKATITSDKVDASWGEKQSTISYSGNVFANDESMKLSCENMQVLLNVQDDNKDAKVEKITGNTNVKIIEKTRKTTSDLFTVLPDDKKITLQGNCKVNDLENDAVLNSNFIEIDGIKNILIAKKIDDKDKKPFVLLPKMQNFSENILPINENTSSQKTKLSSNYIEMKKLENETNFVFKEDVEIYSDDISIKCGLLNAYCPNDANGKAQIDKIEASKEATVTQKDFIANAEIIEIFPKAKDAKSNEKARFISLKRFKENSVFRPKITISQSNLENTLTEISSDYQELINTKENSQYFFRGNVEVRSDNMFARCDNAKLIPNPDKKDEENKIEEIIASGQVYIRQPDKEASCQLLNIYPKTGKILLRYGAWAKNLEDEKSIEGDQIAIYKNEKYAVVEPLEDGQKDGKNRSNLILPSIPSSNILPLNISK